MAFFGHPATIGTSQTGGWRTPPRLLAAALIIAAAALTATAFGLARSADDAAVAPALDTAAVQTASSWSMTPFPQPQSGEITNLTPAAAALAGDLATRYGVVIAVGGQDWGATVAQQEMNVGAVQQAFAILPPAVTEAVTADAANPLTILSNAGGRTLAGAQPYGADAPSFYTNIDGIAANQVVVRPGTDAMTIAHEVLHAYQLRHEAPGEYVRALLGDEMRSFMQATGWRQVASDDAVMAVSGEPWAATNSLFVYEGRALTYTAAGGASVTLRPDNPLEAYATIGALYYQYRATGNLPDWAEYWAWFEANLAAE